MEAGPRIPGWFAGDGTHLERYASRLNAVEINSSFYRSHRPATYAKWASCVGPEFRFSVKVPRLITHEHRLKECSAQLDEFLWQCGALGDRLGCLLLQLPPSLAFDTGTASRFFEALRSRFSGAVVIEPRHETWAQAQSLLIDQQIAQAAVDPGRIQGDDVPAGWPGLRYWRLHGSPHIYHSAYEPDWLEHLAHKIRPTLNDVAPTWCIFDNTARDAALGNALFTQVALPPGFSETP